MQEQFVDYETAKMLKELGFDDECITSYQQMQYPINDSGNSYNKSLCLTIDCEMPLDEQRVLWIEKENAHFHWHEGTYRDGEHSRCELEGEDCKAPMWQQVEEWLWRRCGICFQLMQVRLDKQDSLSFYFNIFREYIQYEGEPYEQMLFGMIRWNVQYTSSPIDSKICAIKAAVQYLHKLKHPANTKTIS